MKAFGTDGRFKQSRVFVVSVLLGGLGCSASGSRPEPVDPGPVTSQSSPDSGVVDAAASSDAGVPTFGDDAGEPTAAVLFYAHTDRTLFVLDSSDVRAPAKRIGDFDCIGGTDQASSMTDLGVTSDGRLFGVSERAAYPLTIQGGEVHCDAEWPLPTNARFYGLTVAPAGTVAEEEVLIAANGAGELFRIDANSGTTTQVGTLGRDPKTRRDWSLSGDIVFLANGKSPVGFATVRTCTGTAAYTCSEIDTLIEIDVQAVKPGTQSVLKSVRGQVVRGPWCTKADSPPTFGSMYGVAAYGSRVYGFSRRGDLVEIDNRDGTACLVRAYTDEKFAGAGVTTLAPVIVPPR